MTAELDYCKALYSVDCMALSGWVVNFNTVGKVVPPRRTQASTAVLYVYQFD